jgi:hypothetical protein
MQDEHQALQNSDTWVWDLVLERSSEAPSLIVALSSTVDLIEGHADAMDANRVHYWACLVLTTILSHFPELDIKLELLGSEYNANLTKDEMEVFWTRTHRASESLSSRVHPWVARSPPDGAGEE